MMNVDENGDYKTMESLLEAGTVANEKEKFQEDDLQTVMYCVGKIKRVEQKLLSLLQIVQLYILIKTLNMIFQ